MELKNCPFCGSKAVEVRWAAYQWKIDCTGWHGDDNGDCFCEGTAETFKTKQLAAKAWNTRADG